MAKKHPVEPLVDQISELLNQYDENLDSKLEGDITPEIFTMMANLEMRVGAAQEALIKTMEQENLTEQDLVNISNKKSLMPEKDRQVFDKLGMLGNEVRTLNRAMERVVESDKKAAAKTGKPVKRRLGDSSHNLGIAFRRGWDKL